MRSHILQWKLFLFVCFPFVFLSVAAVCFVPEWNLHLRNYMALASSRNGTRCELQNNIYEWLDAEIECASGTKDVCVCVVQICMLVNFGPTRTQSIFAFNHSYVSRWRLFVAVFSYAENKSDNLFVSVARAFCVCFFPSSSLSNATYKLSHF